MVKHKKTHERYALKELAISESQEVRHQAINELKIARKHMSNTEHLVGFINAFFDEGKIYLLLEFCDGGSLEDLLKQTPPPPAPPQQEPPPQPTQPPHPPAAKVKKGSLPLGPIVVQLLHGLRYMHTEMRQVHRDLKPANVLLTSRGVVKLNDFGISKQLSTTSALAMTQVGSTAYMSPERLQGDEYDFSSDLWSVGVIVLEALLGEHPFPPSKHPSYISLYQAIVAGKAPPPPPDTPPEVADALRQCMQVDAGARPSVGELLGCDWLAQVAKTDTRQPVFTFLMKAAARAMADKAIARSAMETPDAK